MKKSMWTQRHEGYDQAMVDAARVSTAAPIDLSAERAREQERDEFGKVYSVDPLSLPGNSVSWPIFAIAILVFLCGVGTLAAALATSGLMAFLAGFLILVGAALIIASVLLAVEALV